MATAWRNPHPNACESIKVEQGNVPKLASVKTGLKRVQPRFSQSHTEGDSLPRRVVGSAIGFLSDSNSGFRWLYYECEQEVPNSAAHDTYLDAPGRCQSGIDQRNTPTSMPLSFHME